jgi:hypothetical protein
VTQQARRPARLMTGLCSAGGLIRASTRGSLTRAAPSAGAGSSCGTVVA